MFQKPIGKFFNFGAILTLLFLALGITAGVVLADFNVSSQVSFTLSACRLPDADHNGIPDYTLPLNGLFVCNDADYTTGNLGKMWNELDLVPHRLTTQSGNQSGATTDYNVIIAADNQTGGATGYDIVSVPVVNDRLSDSSCTVSAGPQSTTGGVTGGADQVIYRTLTIHQDKGTTCVFDYYQRLALGAHLYPGSSLQSYMFESSDFKTGKKTISIPVNQILPQELHKDMSAVQGTDHAWNIYKAPTPASLNFANTCDNTQPLTADVTIKVSWEKLAASPSGPVTVITHVYAKNPASRPINVTITDNIYKGTTQTDLLDSAQASATVPANTDMLVLTHTFVWNSPDTTTLNDVATGTYTDQATGIPVPGQTETKASATIQNTGPESNATATINDVESITGSGLSYSVDSFTGASGSFDNGYVAGTKTTANVSWTSVSQSDNGSVTFGKTIYVTKGTIESNGNLYDVATLTGSSGFTTTAKADVAISVDTIASMTIEKTIPNILQGDETATFLFTVKDSSGKEVASPSISFAAGNISKSTDVLNLVPGVYTVSETTLSGFDPQDPKTVDLSGAVCAGTVSFTNTAVPAKSSVQKVTVPAGFEAGWTFDLMQGANVLETVTTTGSSAMNFTTKLGEGTYSIVETSQAGWQSDGGKDCTFTVNLPGDADKTFACTFTNTYQPSISLTKTGDTYSKVGDTIDYTITLTNTSVNGGAAGAPSLDCALSDPTIGFEKSVTDLAPGGTDTSNPSYVVQPADPDPLVNTVTATCTYHGLTETVVTKDAKYSTDLLHPDFTVTKACKANTEPIPQAGTAVFTITFKNTGDADLHVVPSEGDPFSVAAEGTSSYNYSVAGPFTDTVSNTVTGTVTLAAKYGLNNNYTFSQTGSCTVEGKATVVKTVSGAAPAAGQAFTFEIRKDASTTSVGSVLETQTTDANGNITFNTSLVPGQTYQICEWVFVGWNTNLSGDSPLFVPNSIIPPALPNPNVINLYVCTDFTVASGKIRTFTVDNTPPPGGRALTIGFWKNWASCSTSNGKGQKPILDQTLALAEPTGIIISATGNPYSNLYLVLHSNSCLQAVRLLDKSTIDTNKKMASNPAFNLAAQLIGAKLNLTAGAYTNPTVVNTVNQAVLLLGKYKFDGTSTWASKTKISAADANTMNTLAKTLDDYNNNR